MYVNVLMRLMIVSKNVKVKIVRDEAALGCVLAVMAVWRGLCGPHNILLCAHACVCLCHQTYPEAKAHMGCELLSPLLSCPSLAVP